MLAGFEETVLECKTEKSRIQILEAIRCYESRSYRAAIVMSHMAVCFDLLDKLQALAATGDAEARQQIIKFENYQTQLNTGNQQAISNLLAFERSLLEIFRDKFDFFGANEYDDLVRLRDDRNRCAHPTFFKTQEPYEPSAELARLHIRNALSLVLTQEPRQGKAAIEQLKQLILSKYFPENFDDATERLKILGLENARTSLITAFVDELVFGLADKDNPLFKKIPAYNALDATIELRRETAAPRAAKAVNKLYMSNNDDAMAVGSTIVLRNNDIQDMISDASKQSVKSWITKVQDPFIVDEVCRALKIDWLAAAAKDRLKTLTAEEMSKGKPNMPDIMLQHAAELYCEAKTWDQANKLSNQVAIPFSGNFKEQHIRYIFKQCLEKKTDLRGSHGFGEFIKKLHQENPIGKPEIDKILEEFDLEYYQ